MEKSLRLGFKASNNKAEYDTIIAKLQVACKLGVEKVEVFSNSKFVVNQVDGSFEAQDQCMCQYLKLIEGIRNNFRAVTMNRISRNQNSHADSLATLASSLSDLIPRLVLVEALEHPSIELQTTVATISE